MPEVEGMRASNAMHPAPISSVKKQVSAFKARSTLALDKPADIPTVSIVRETHGTPVTSPSPSISRVKALALQTKDALERVWDTEEVIFSACFKCHMSL